MESQATELKPKDQIQQASEFIEQVLKPESDVSKKLKIKSFQGAIVADIGTRDGRYVSALRNLGAKEVFGIDPDISELEKAILQGILDRSHVLNGTAQEASKKFRNKFDVCVVFNISPLLLDNIPNFMNSVDTMLKENGQIIVTFSEYSTYDRFRNEYRSHADWDRGEFDFSKSRDRVLRKGDYRESNPHKYIMVIDKASPAPPKTSLL